MQRHVQLQEYYECRGVPIVQKANFVSASPWIIPFCISSFKSDHMKMLTELLPTSIKLYDRKYKLAGLTLHKNVHFTALCFGVDLSISMLVYSHQI